MSERTGKFKSILYVAFSRGVSMVSGVVVGLLLPKVLRVQDYGFLKIYTLYVAYTALLHFGFVDGILLRLAGLDYNSLEKEQMRLYTRFFAIFQAMIGAVMIAVGALLSNADYRFILIMLGINMIIINLTTYYQFVSQATRRFAEYSAGNLIISAIKTAFVLVLLLCKATGWFRASYRFYIICLNLIDATLLLWYIVTYRDITFGKRTALKGNWKDIGSMFKQGILLTVAYQMSHLVFMLDRQFVSVLYDTETYAVYSFAYNIVTLISTMISSLSVVLLPMLKRATSDYIQRYFGKTLSGVSVIVGASITAYFPLVAIITWFLPEYAGSISYLKIVVPTLMYSCCLTVVMFTFSKVLDQNLAFFKTGCFALLVGIVTNTVAYAGFGTPESISYASLVTMALWFVVEGRRLSKYVNGSITREFVYITLLCMGFLTITLLMENLWLSGGAYLLLYLGASTLCYRSYLPQLSRKVKNICSRK